MTISIVLADASILCSRTLRDYVLYVADEGAIEIHWSQDILDEMSRNLQENLGFSRDDTARLEELMNDCIEYGLIDVERADLATVDHVEMDAKDRTSSRPRSRRRQTSSSLRTPNTFLATG